MSDTFHHVHSTPDPYRVGLKIERKARPAGRLNRIIAEELAELEDDARLEALAVSFEPDDSDSGWDTMWDDHLYWSDEALDMRYEEWMR